MNTGACKSFLKTQTLPVREPDWISLLDSNQLVVIRRPLSSARFSRRDRERSYNIRYTSPAMDQSISVAVQGQAVDTGASSTSPSAPSTPIEPSKKIPAPKRKRTGDVASDSADSASQPPRTRDGPKKKKANRACFHCQKAHLTCDDCECSLYSLHLSTAIWSVSVALEWRGNVCCDVLCGYWRVVTCAHPSASHAPFMFRPDVCPS